MPNGLTPEEKQSLEALMNKLSTEIEQAGEFHIFTSREVKLIRNMIEGWQLIIAWGRLGKIIFQLVLGISAFWIAAKAFPEIFMAWFIK
jgi:hypothetical protein